MFSTSAIEVDQEKPQVSPKLLRTVCLSDGRSLKFGPAWTCSDAAVLFDRHSGDYWVLSLLAIELIKSMQGSAFMSIEALERQLQGSLQDVDLSADLLPTLQSLADNGLVMLKC